MKTIIVSFLMVVMTMSAEAINISQSLIDSICMVESRNNPNAVGDNGKSIGIAQIQKICVDDVNRIIKITKINVNPFTYDDRKSVSKSKEMMKIYLSFYGKRYLRKTGKIPDEKILSRIWNGGPDGWKEKSTYAYMMKVSKYLYA